MLELRINSPLTRTLKAPMTFQLGQVVMTAELVRAGKNQGNFPTYYRFAYLKEHASASPLPRTFFPRLDVHLVTSTHHPSLLLDLRPTSISRC